MRNWLRKYRTLCGAYRGTHRGDLICGSLAKESFKSIRADRQSNFFVDTVTEIVVKHICQYTNSVVYGSVERCIDFTVTPHILRHTYLTRCFENGLDLKEVQYLAGHKTPELTMRIYLHYQQEERKKQTFEKVKQMNPA